MYQTNQDPNVDINTKYFTSQENEQSNMLHNKRNSGVISNLNENTQTYNSKKNPERYYLNNLGTSTTNQNYFIKLNNIYEDDYNRKYINKDNKYDISRNGIINKDEYNYRNTTFGKNGFFQGRPISKLSVENNNYKNNINKRDISTERSPNRDYKYQKINYTNLNNTTSPIIETRTNRQHKNKIIVKDDKYINRNTREIENDYLNVNKHNQKSNNNKSMDSKIINQDNNDHDHDKHIININNGKIINLSNLDKAFSYATDKYSCFYVNKREKVKLKGNVNNQAIKLNVSKYYVNKKPKLENNEINQIINHDIVENNKENTNPKKISNSKTTYFEHKIQKRESNKYPVRINLTNENVNRALLENESLEEQKDYKNKNKEINSTQINTKNIRKINFHNSFNNNKKKNQTNKNFYNTERIIKNDLIKNNQQNKEREKEIIKEREREREVEKEKEKRNKKKRIIIYDDNFSNNNNNQNNLNNTLNNYNLKSIGVGNRNERNEIKISNGVRKKTDYSFNHEQLSINTKKINNNNNNNNKTSLILKIKSNDKLTILNNPKKIDTSNLNNKNKEEKKKTYKISSNVVNEQFYKEKFMEKELNSDDENYLTISMQSLNDSNIMEIANRYITEEEGLDKNEINEILNSKKKD